VNIKPAEIIVPKHPSKELDQDSVKTLLSTFNISVEKNLTSAGYLKASNTDKKTICIRPIITLVEQPNLLANYTMTALLVGPVTRGGVTTIIDAYDCTTQERLAADSMTGMASAFGDFTGSYSKLGHAKIKLEESAEHFSNLIKPK
jgi:hypothetical protein